MVKLVVLVKIVIMFMIAIVLVRIAMFLLGLIGMLCRIAATALLNRNARQVARPTARVNSDVIDVRSRVLV